MQSKKYWLLLWTVWILHSMDSSKVNDTVHLFTCLFSSEPILTRASAKVQPDGEDGSSRAANTRNAGETRDYMHRDSIGKIVSTFALDRWSQL